MSAKIHCGDENFTRTKTYSKDLCLGVVKKLREKAAEMGKGTMQDLMGPFDFPELEELLFEEEVVYIDPYAGKCFGIPKTWTGAYMADYYGNWAGMLNFKPTHSLYTFTINDYEGDWPVYTELMNRFNQDLNELGTAMTSNNLAENLLIWSTWMSRQAVSNGINEYDQEISLNGDPKVIMKGENIDGVIATYSGDLPGSLVDNSYDSATGEFSMLLSYSALTSSAYSSFFNPFVLGYKYSDNDLFLLKLDVTTAFIAISQGYNVLGLNTLDEFVLVDNVAHGFYLGVPYMVSRYYHPDYAGMAPLYCFGPKYANSSSWNCGVKVGKSYGFVFLTHKGANDTSPTWCNCSTSTGRSSQCNKFDLMLGVGIYDYTANSSATANSTSSFAPFLPLIELFYTMSYPYSQIAENVYIAAWYSLYGNLSDAAADPRRNQAFNEVSTPSFGFPTLIIWSSTSDDSSFVTDDLLQLTTGSCNDSVTTPFFNQLVFVNSFGPLVEDNFFQCTYNATDAISATAGNSVSLAGLLVGASMFVLFKLIKIHRGKRKAFIKAYRKKQQIEEEKHEQEEEGFHEGIEDGGMGKVKKVAWQEKEIYVREEGVAYNVEHKGNRDKPQVVYSEMTLRKFPICHEMWDVLSDGKNLNSAHDFNEFCEKHAIGCYKNLAYLDEEEFLKLCSMCRSTAKLRFTELLKNMSTKT